MRMVVPYLEFSMFVDFGNSFAYDAVDGCVIKRHAIQLMSQIPRVSGEIR